MRNTARIGLLTDFALARFRLRSRRSPLPSPASELRNILVIRCDRIGDFALWAPWAAALRRAFPADRCRLTLLGSALWMPLAREVLDFDGYLPVEPRRFVEERSCRASVLAELGRSRWDEVWQCRPFREPWLEDLVAMTAAAPRTVGFAAGSHALHRRAGRLGDAAYTEMLSADDSGHESCKNAAFARAAAGRALRAEPCFRRLPEPPAPWRRGEYAVLLPGGSKSAGCRWRPELFAEVCRAELPAGLPVAVAGTPDELPLLRRSAEALGPAASVASGLGITDFAALIAGALLVVGNDTGGIHLAAMSGVPSAAAVGAGVPHWFLPYPADDAALPPGAEIPECVCGGCSDAGCFWRCRHAVAEGGMYRCFAAISVDAMREAVRRAVRRAVAKRPE